QLPGADGAPGKWCGTVSIPCTRDVMTRSQKFSFENDRFDTQEAATRHAEECARQLVDRQLPDLTI
ncbi:MAG: hypothetical protein ABI552_14905, partial [Casimicrobiaceae bacterium]